MSEKRSVLIVDSHLNITSVITANYDRLSHIYTVGSHGAKSLDLGAIRCFEHMYM